MQNLPISTPEYCLLSLLLASCASAADLQVQGWGIASNGTQVEKTCVSNETHMQVCYIDYGATITSVTVPDRHGKMENIVLSLPDLPSYLKTRHRHAAIIGRYAGRIANAQFNLNGKLVQLIPNQRGLAVHGDPYGFDKRVWQRRDFVDDQSLGSVFHLISPDGDQGMPGELDVNITYRLLRASNEFRLEYSARSTAPTVINLTNHAYFNLAGAGSSGLASHLFQIASDRYAETDDKRVPTGNLLSVQDTALDFRAPTGINQRLGQAANELGKPPGYDHSLVFSDWNGQLKLVAHITESQSGRSMQVSTTEPSVQFFSGNGFDGSEIGSEGEPYQRHDGFAFETQHLPDSPNHANFPTTLLNPGQVFHSVTSFRFSTLPALKR